MRIHLNDMIFYGHHGVHPEERKLGQRFQVDFTFETDPANDMSIKHLHDTIDYTQVYSLIKDILEVSEFYLLEDCANTILDTIMNKFPTIIRTSVRIRKPSVPIKGSLSSVEIEMDRIR
jgi:7,8-dihydroneopterin aldolase/epimerase/oxygenase